MNDQFYDRRKPGFFIIDNDIFEFGLTPHELSVYAAFSYLDYHNLLTSPAAGVYATIGNLANVPEGQVIQCIDSLEQRGLVVLVRGEGDNE